MSNRYIAPQVKTESVELGVFGLYSVNSMTKNTSTSKHARGPKPQSFWARFLHFLGI